MEVESNIANVPTVLYRYICISKRSCVVYSFNIWILRSYTYIFVSLFSFSLFFFVYFSVHSILLVLCSILHINIKHILRYSRFSKCFVYKKTVYINVVCITKDGFNRLPSIKEVCVHVQNVMFKMLRKSNTILWCFLPFFFINAVSFVDYEITLCCWCFRIIYFLNVVFNFFFGIQPSFMRAIGIKNYQEDKQIELWVNFKIWTEETCSRNIRW